MGKYLGTTILSLFSRPKWCQTNHFRTPAALLRPAAFSRSFALPPLASPFTKEAERGDGAMQALCHARVGVKSCWNWTKPSGSGQDRRDKSVPSSWQPLSIQSGPSKKGISESVFGSDLGYLKRGFKIQNDQSIFEFVNLKFGPAWMFLEGTRKHQEICWSRNQPPFCMYTL